VAPSKTVHNRSRQCLQSISRVIFAANPAATTRC
jgi:hypothetical protein